MKIFITTILLSFGLSSFAQSQFQKPSSNKPIQNRGVITQIIASIPYQGYDETQAYLGEGEYEILLDNVDGVLDKPIIILDGFDPGDSRDITGLYNSLAFGGQNIGDIVRNEGYDIVVLNAPLYTTNGKDIDGGADYIQRNAMVLVEMINFINAEKEGNEELVILGPSMGGLIARYALSYMEQNSLQAQTRLFISFDSPHKGANVPISLQYLINYLAEEFDDPDAQAVVASVLNSPAAKEMLVDHLSAHLLAGSTTEQDPTKLLPEGAPNFRNAFQAEMDALGFPQNVRNVTMINGNATGITSGTPGMEVVNTTLPILFGTTADIALYFMPQANQSITITDWTTNLFGVPIGAFAADGSSTAISDGVDSAPGGTSNMSAALGGGGSSNPIIVDFVNALNQDAFCFIPTISALAIDEDNWYATPNLADSPFAAAYIPSENEDHVTVTSASAQFAINEIDPTIVLGQDDVIFQKKYNLSQNPANQFIILNVKTQQLENITIKIYNVAGQLALNKTIELTSSNLEIENTLSPGFYSLIITDSDGSHVIKLLKK